MNNTLECVLCASGTSPSFENGDELHAHILQHDYDYESEGILQDDEVQQVIIGDGLCPLCGMEVDGGIEGLREHVGKICEGDKRKRFACKNCTASFGRRCELKRHDAEVHARVRPYLCDHANCFKSFTRRDALLKHVAVVHQRQRRYQCEDCPEKFSTNYDLKRHMQRAHQGYRPYRCSLCSAGFTQKSQLTMHKTRSHRFVCDNCEHVLWGIEAYEDHVQECENALQNVQSDTQYIHLEQAATPPQNVMATGSQVNNLQSQSVPIDIEIQAQT